MTETQSPHLSGKSAQNWHCTLLFGGARLHDAIRNLDQSALQIALVISADGRLLGTLTDGDIRRGLLRGLNLESPIESVVNYHPFVVPPTLGRDMVLELMQVNHLRQLPVVDADHRVVGLHLWDEIAAPSLPNSIVIMAGGLGTRLRPHTENCPKPMLQVAGKPMLEYIIERAKADGFEHVIIAVQYLGHMIEDHFGDGERFGVRIEYLREPTPLGTAGALSLLAPRPTLPFIVTNGDVLSDIRYGELLDFHVRHAAVATMAVRLHEWQHPFGVVQTQGVDIVGFEEKPVARTHINAGIYALSPEALDGMAANFHCDMPTLFEQLQAEGKRTVAYPMHEPWLDVGRPDDLNRANAENGGKH